MSWLYTAPLWLIVVLITLMVLGALEAGHWLGRLAPVEDKQVATISAPIVAMVGLLLAFSFSITADRYAARRQATVQEANAVGTFWLRTALVPEPVRSQMRSRVRRYVDVHLAHRQAGTDTARLQALEMEATRLQQELWDLFVADAERAPEAARVRLVAPALNEMIDDAATALAAKENRLPDAIFDYLLALVAIAGVVLGYRPRAERRNWVLWGLFVVVVVSTLAVLCDMDRPRRGFIESDKTPYLRLRESMQSP